MKPKKITDYKSITRGPRVAGSYLLLKGDAGSAVVRSAGYMVGTKLAVRTPAMAARDILAGGEGKDVMRVSLLSLAVPRDDTAAARFNDETSKVVGQRLTGAQP